MAFTARSYKLDGLSVALISICSLFILLPITDTRTLTLDWTSSQGLFVAILTSILVPELFRYFKLYHILLLESSRFL